MSAGAKGPCGTHSAVCMGQAMGEPQILVVRSRYGRIGEEIALRFCQKGFNGVWIDQYRYPRNESFSDWSYRLSMTYMSGNAFTNVASISSSSDGWNNLAQDSAKKISIRTCTRPSVMRHGPWICAAKSCDSLTLLPGRLKRMFYSGRKQLGRQTIYTIRNACP